MTNEVLWSTKGKRGYDYTYSPARNVMIAISEADRATGDVWNLSTGQQQLLTFQHIVHSQRRCWSYDVSATGNHIMVYNEEAVEVWDLSELKFLLVIAGLNKLERACFNGDGSLVICRVEGEIVVFDVANGEKISSFECSLYIQNLVCSPSGTYCGSNSYRDKIDIWNIRTGEMKLSKHYHIDSFCFAKDDEYVVTIYSSPCRMTTWDLASGTILFEGIIWVFRRCQPAVQLSVSSSTVVLRGHMAWAQFTLEVDPLSGKEVARGEEAYGEPPISTKLYIHGALTILL
jgi:WD40 repeat protein